MSPLRHGRRLVAALPLAMLLAAVAAGAAKVGDWQRGRSSWYGNQEGEFVGKFADTRIGGRDAFGIVEWGACGYTNSDGSLIFDQTRAAAYSDVNPDSGGSCGRCYEVRCSPGKVLGWEDAPVNFSNNFFPFWENGAAADDQGRSFPGIPEEHLAQKHLSVSCWDPERTIRVKIVDNCPCFYEQVDPPRYQYACCYKTVEHEKAGQIEFDLTYWAFQELAHPMYGIMMVDFRPVDCESGSPLPFLPGHVSSSLYDEAPGTGWAWYRYKTVEPQTNETFSAARPGLGIGGSNGTCAALQPDGGMAFYCRFGCGGPGQPQPFAGKSALSFWVRDRVNPDTVPPIKLIVGNSDNATFCNAKPYLPNLEPAEATAAGGGGERGWRKFVVPLTDFDCTGLDPSQVNIVNFEVDSGAGPRTDFCLDDVQLI